MPRFFIRKDQISDENGVKTVTITGDDAHHISRSLRMAQGEEIEVCDMQKVIYRCTLEEFLSDRVVARVKEERDSDTEPKHFIRLYQALPKSDKMETIIQKGVECGVCEIVPFSSERCIVRLDKKDESKKLDRWQKISESAAKQSGRGIIPEIKGVLSFNEMLSSLKGTVLFCYEGEEQSTIKEVLKNTNTEKEISLIVGSEGGFSKKEADLIIQAGGISVGLGKRILRCETAPIFALSCIVYETEL